MFEYYIILLVVVPIVLVAGSIEKYNRYKTRKRHKNKMKIIRRDTINIDKSRGVI